MSYTCDSCNDPSNTLISHPYVTGHDRSLDPHCLFIMANTLYDLKNHCPVCMYAIHDLDCIVRKLRGNV